MCMKLDDLALDEIVSNLNRYYQKQIDLIKTYYHDISGLEEDWSGNNFDDLASKVESICNTVENSLDGIKMNYTKYFSQKADMIRQRPAFSGTSLGGGSSSSSATSKESFFDKVFEKFNKDIVTKIYMYLRRINFYVPNERICFYDPNGKSKRGLYKNIMAIDLNSPTFKDDMLLLTGQHLFFQLQHIQQMRLIRSLSVEIENKSLLNDVEFKKLAERIKSGSGIEKKFLSFPNQDTALAFNFFTNAFATTLSNDTEGIKKYQKYFSNSYGNFREILHNLISF